MDFFNQTPEEIATLSLIVAINIANQYDLDKLAVIIAFISAVNSNLGLIAVERGIFEKASTSSDNNSTSNVSDLEKRISELEDILSETKPYS